jgi:hypothetical protein
MFLRLFSCLYITYSLPLRFAFYENFELSEKYKYFAALDALATLFFIIEMFATFRKFNSKIAPTDDGINSSKSSLDSSMDSPNSSKSAMTESMRR